VATFEGKDHDRDHGSPRDDDARSLGWNFDGARRFTDGTKPSAASAGSSEAPEAVIVPKDLDDGQLIRKSV